jgi:hypothetical protein
VTPASFSPHDVDPFDLPEWLLSPGVLWRSEEGLRSTHLVRGTLQGGEGEELGCALLAVDDAYPVPVVDDAVRTRVHQAWHHGQALLVEVDGTLTVAVPGRRLDAELVMEALARLARAVGASPEEYAVLLRIGSARR